MVQFYGILNSPENQGEDDKLPDKASEYNKQGSYKSKPATSKEVEKLYHFVVKF
jgi:hypothetical protein